MKIELANLVSTAADRMKLDIQALRQATDHAGLKGAGAEAVVADFLRDRLPKSLAVTTGHVVDSSGRLSKQEDVIVYDALRTPVIFKSAYNGWDVVPAEGVVAAIEVKMRLTAAMLEDIVANGISVLSLDRSAYFGQPIPSFELHGQSWTELPILYSVFAFESDKLYASQWNALLAEHPLQNRIASVCSLDRGVNLSLELPLPEAAFSPTPTSLGLVDIVTPNALLLWFTSLSSAALQAKHRPIDLMRYAKDQHQGLTASVNHSTAEEGKAYAIAQGEILLGNFGLPAGIAERIFSGQSVTPEQEQALLAAGWVQKGGSWTSPL